jgi:hypothetical protein
MQPDLDRDDFFEPDEAPAVIREYVCAVCHEQLAQQYQPSERLVLIVCPEHGSVTRVGRVMKSSVSMEMEKSLKKFRPVINNLSDLWGELIPAKKSAAQLLHELGF